MNDHISVNMKLWDERVGYHLNSGFYDKDGFLNGKISISDLEQELLGNISGKSILHLQCHFGMDTISLSRMGAIATGVDFSQKAINAAEKLTIETRQNAKFICSDIYDLPSVLDQKFNIVFTSFGVIGWLPDLNKWAGVIQHFLEPGGKFIIAEFHPVVWMFDNDFKKIEYSYFNERPIRELEEGTYADKNAPFQLESITWNHSLSEVMQSLMQHGIEITDFKEYDYSPYNCFNETIEIEPGKFNIKNLQHKIPMTYSITGQKKKATPWNESANF